jgi:hypothetical protein
MPPSVSTRFGAEKGNKQRAQRLVVNGVSLISGLINYTSFSGSYSIVGSFYQNPAKVLIIVNHDDLVEEIAETVSRSVWG